MLCLLSIRWEVGERTRRLPAQALWVCLFVCLSVPGHSYPLQSTPGRQGTPALCAAGSEGDPPPEGCAAAAEYVRGHPSCPANPSPFLPRAPAMADRPAGLPPSHCIWEQQDDSGIRAGLSCVQLESQGAAVPRCSLGTGQVDAIY